MFEWIRQKNALCWSQVCIASVNYRPSQSALHICTTSETTDQLWLIWRRPVRAAELPIRHLSLTHKQLDVNTSVTQGAALAAYPTPSRQITLTTFLHQSRQLINDGSVLYDLALQCLCHLMSDAIQRSTIIWHIHMCRDKIHQSI